MKRYNQLLQLIDLIRPQSIIETGVWNGHNGVRMLRRASLYNKCSYRGYDLFEDATPELDAKELNVKHHNTVEDIQKLFKLELPDGSVTLYKGDTNSTLQPQTIADFVFIDGGHSLDTIQNDYEKLSRSKVIVLDDFYSPDDAGRCPDISKYGCNRLVAGLKKGFVLLPQRDPVKGGGFTQFALVTGG